MSRAKALAYTLTLPLGLLALVLLPAGDFRWTAGWVFIAVLVVAFGISALVLARLNPAIYRARSRFQPGTRKWDLVLLSIMLPMMVAIIPVAALDAGRFGWSHVPLWVEAAGYAAILASIGVTTWAQVVNPFFEPGVRIQSERHQRVVDIGPYQLVRHPGYSAAILLFFGMAFALGSWWALAPAGIASTLLVVRTAWEDRLLKSELPGYRKFATRTRYRLFPGVW
jgi:protein-S-isoprenylcysteine O-methyltransferase Ste14